MYVSIMSFNISTYRPEKISSTYRHSSLKFLFRGYYSLHIMDWIVHFVLAHRPLDCIRCLMLSTVGLALSSTTSSTILSSETFNLKPGNKWFCISNIERFSHIIFRNYHKFLDINKK